MTEIPITASGCNAKVPVIRCDAKIADEAYAVHRALQIAAAEDPALYDNTLWKFFAKVAFERFEIAFGGE